MTARIRIIRHGDASAAPAASNDPGLSLTGVRQALDLPKQLGADPAMLLTSPLARARETALPISGAYGVDRIVVDEYGELPWRDGQTVAQRRDDIADVLGSSWSNLRVEWRDWRSRLIERALSERGDVIVVSHFVAINVLVGFATGDDRTVVVSPANASVTEFALENGTLSVTALGRQMPLPTSPNPIGTGH